MNEFDNELDNELDFDDINCLSWEFFCFCGIMFAIPCLPVVLVVITLGDSKDKPAYNYEIDYNDDGVSILKIKKYTHGKTKNTVEFSTKDGLLVFTGMKNVEFLYANSVEEAYARAVEFAGGDESNIIFYDMLRNLPVDDYETSEESLKDNYEFNYAITEDKNGVIVRNISNVKISNGIVKYYNANGGVYTDSINDVKLINSSCSTDDAVYDYAYSLAGSENRIFGDVDREKGVVKQLIKR